MATASDAGVLGPSQPGGSPRRATLCCAVTLCCLAASCGSGGNGWGPPFVDGGDDADARDLPDGAVDDGEGDGGGHYHGDAGPAGLDGDGLPPGERCQEGECSFEGATDETDECLNGSDEDGNGLIDCADFGCLPQPVCCREVSASALRGDFQECSSLDLCGWTSFFTEQDSAAANGQPVRLEDGRARLGGDGVAEVGFYSEPLVGLAGEPTVTMVAGLSPEGCNQDVGGGCRQALGLAVTTQQAVTSGTGVFPLAGLVLDGELNAIHYYVGGRLAESVPAFEEGLTSTLGYAFKIGSDGTIEFWVGLTPEEVADPAALPAVADFTSTALVDIQTRVRVVVFGRLTGSLGAEVHEIDFHRRICDVPRAWTRVTPRPVLSPIGPGERAASPTVTGRPGGGYLMAYESRDNLAIATSDDGMAWDFQGAVLTKQAPTDYGRVARRSPAIIYWAIPGEDPQFHLWFEGEAEPGPEDPPGVVPTAIMHAVSPDGLDWYEPAEEGPVVVGSSSRSWRREVRQPTVAEGAEGILTLWFVGRDPETGETNIGHAISVDGKEWAVLDEPVTILGDVAAFERDGLAHPTVISRGDLWLMWYAGLNGARSSIGYAVSSDGDTWLRYGEVLAAEEPWEEGRLGSPTVITRPTASPSFQILHLWYQGGLPGAENVGLALREVPVLVTALAE